MAYPIIIRQMIVWAEVGGKIIDYSCPNATVHVAGWKQIYLWLPVVRSTIRSSRCSFQWQHIQLNKMMKRIFLIVVVDVTTDELMIYLRIIIYKDIHAYIHMYMYACLNTYVQIYKHTYVHACIHTYIHTHMHTYLCIYIHSYIHIYMLTYMHSYVHPYVYQSWIHTYILTNFNGHLKVGLPKFNSH